jgi:ubiquinone/menaquinone biosynthesis C-methylase UbiE
LPKTIFEILAPIYDRFINGDEKEEFYDIIRNNKSEIILEIGAGTARTAKNVKSLCDQLWLLEPSQKMLQRGKKKIKVANWIHGFAENIPVEDNFFDIVYAIDTLHHVDSIPETIKEIKRVLKTGGLFILIDFDPKTKKGHYIKYMEKMLLMNSIFLSPKDVALLFNKHQLKITNFSYLDSGTYLLAAKKK